MLKHKGMQFNSNANIRSEIEHSYLSKITSEVESQNQKYFENKTKELLLKSDVEEDMFSRACASLLLQSSNLINREKVEKEVEILKRNPIEAKKLIQSD